MQFAKRVWDFSTSHDLLHDGDQVVLGVSGGPDSLCLLDVLSRLAPQHGLRLRVAHLNHGLRREAAGEAAFVQAEAERRGLDYFSETVDVASAATASKQSIETTARALRYDFLERVARRTGARLVAVAHSADDQAETVLLHLLRGAGLRGLRGMLPKRVIGERVIGKLVIGNSSAAAVGPLPVTNYQLPLFLIRPLLSVTRAEILAYCDENQLTPSIDSSNADLHYFRNRLRLELLPVLERYNPNVRTMLARTATVAAGDYELWLQAAQSLWAATLAGAPADPRQVVFDRERWRALSLAQQRALLRLAVDKLRVGPEEIDFAPLEAAAQFSRRAGPGHSCELAAGLTLRVEVEQIIVSGHGAVLDTTDRPKVVNGELAPGWRLLIEPLGAGGWSLDRLAATTRWTALVDADRVRQPIQLRARRPGDRFQPLGLNGHSVSLAEFMVDQKVPASQRDDWPLVMGGDEMMWVAGLRLDERYKITPDTRQVLRLSVLPDTGMSF